MNSPKKKNENKKRRTQASDICPELAKYEDLRASAAYLLAVRHVAACGDDDDDGGVTEGKMANVMPSVANADIRFPVTAIYEDDSSSPYVRFSYENGRMTSCNYYYDYDGDTNMGGLSAKIPGR